MIDVDGQRSVPFGAMMGVHVVGAVVQYLGYALAVSRYDVLPPVWSAWSRSLLSGLLLVAATRPWDRRRGRDWYRRAAAFGTAVLVMNLASFLAASRLELGVATALEFVGPIALAVGLARSSVARAAAVAGAAGVVLVLWPDLAASGPLRAAGVAFALVSGASWAVYIAMGGRHDSDRDALTAMGVGMTLASLAGTPLIPWLSRATGEETPVPTAGLALTALLIAVSATVVPYSIDRWCIARIGPGAFASVVAVLPVVAAVVGAVVLGQWLEPAQYLGIVAVGLALAWTRRGVDADRTAGRPSAAVSAPHSSQG